MLDPRQPHARVIHPVLGEKFVQDGRYFFLDGSECHGDPSGPAVVREEPSEEAPPPVEVSDNMTEEQVANLSWIEVRNACVNRGFTPKNKGQAIDFLTAGKRPL